MPAQLQLPSERVRDVLAVLGDLKPAEARALLSEVVATLDAAELYALRTLLPPQATKFLPHCVGAATVMNTDPMPWEFVEPPAVAAGAPVQPAEVPKGPSTGEIIAATLPRPDWKPRLVAAGALLLTALTVFLQWPKAQLAPTAAVTDDEVVALVPPPAKKPFAEIPMVPAATARPKPLPPVRAPKRVAAAPAPAPASDLKRPAEAGAPAPKKAGGQKSAPNEWASPFERRQ